MRTLLASLMIASLLLAQDAPAPEPAPKKKDPAKEKQAEIERLVKELEGQLGGEHDAVLRRLIERLRRGRCRQSRDARRRHRNQRLRGLPVRN